MHFSVVFTWPPTLSRKSANQMILKHHTRLWISFVTYWYFSWCSRIIGMDIVEKHEFRSSLIYQVNMMSIFSSCFVNNFIFKHFLILIWEMLWFLITYVKPVRGMVWCSTESLLVPTHQVSPWLEYTTCFETK